MKQVRLSRFTFLLALALMAAGSLDLMAIETIRVRPRRVSVQQGDGAILLLTTRAFPREPNRYVTEFYVDGLPAGVVATVVPDPLYFPDRGHLFLDVASDAPVGSYSLRVFGNVYDGNNFVRTIATGFIRLEIVPPISPMGAAKGNGKRRR